MNNRLNDRTLEYSAAEDSQRLLKHQLNFKWDNLHDSPSKEVVCSSCNRANQVLWTEGGIGESVKEAFIKCLGYIDNSFRAICRHCHNLIDHGRLKVAKFRQDVAD